MFVAKPFRVIAAAHEAPSISKVQAKKESPLSSDRSTPFHQLFEKLEAHFTLFPSSTLFLCLAASIWQRHSSAPQHNLREVLFELFGFLLLVNLVKMSET